MLKHCNDADRNVYSITQFIKAEITRAYKSSLKLLFITFIILQHEVLSCEIAKKGGFNGFFEQ